MKAKQGLGVGAAVAMLALAFVALPAVASAAQWHQGGVLVGGASEKVEVLTEGELELEAGPRPDCVVTDAGFIWNEGGVAKLEVTEFVIQVPCKTAVAGCTVTAAPVSGLPWQGESVGGSLRIAGVEFSNTFSAGCGELSGQTISASGSLEAPYDNATGCLEFNESPGLEAPGLGPVNVSGTDCIVAPEEVTLE